jgi:1-acyl-sn-glycerol-3-phosphate acyltransferase
MKLGQALVSGLIRLGTNISCRIDVDGFERVPRRGPMILAVNHINSLEVPLLVAHLSPRTMIGLAKIETWDSPLMGWLFDLYEAIPIRRGEADLGAIHRCLEALAAGHILAVAPEGTRSYDGKLLKGQPGIALLALHSGAPILPVAHWGGEAYSHNLKRLKRTDFHIRVGKAFTLDAGGDKPVGSVRQEMADEIMYQIAALMPPEYRGIYGRLRSASDKYLNFVN